VAYLATAAVFLCLVLTVAARPATAAVWPVTVAAPYPVRITLDSLSPVAARPDDTMTLTGTLTNATGRQFAGAHLGVRVNGGAEIPGHTERVAPLSPGESLPFTMRVPVPALALGAAGDYSLAIALTGGDDSPLGVTRAHLPWSPPRTGGKPLNVAVVWPVTDTPHMEAVALETGGGARPVFRDDELAGEFEADGRLRQVVEAGEGLSVTWMVDPGLLDEAKGMTGGYRVARTLDSGDPQDSREGRGAGSAADWLSEVRDAVGGRSVVALPYADPDLAALAHGGMRSSGVGTVLGQAARWGKETAEDLLRTPVRDDVAWPYGGALDDGITRLAQSLGADMFITSGQGQGTGGSVRPGTMPGDDTTVLAGDPVVDAVLSRQLLGPGDALAARQELLGALVDARARSLGSPGGLVVVPPRQMPARTARVLADALDVARSAGWVKLVGLDDVAEAETAPATARVGQEGSRSRTQDYRSKGQVTGEIPGPASGGGVGPGQSYPQALRVGELSADDLTAVAAIQPDLGTLSQVLSDPARTTDAVHRAMLRAVSTGWRVEAADGDADDRRSYTGGVRAYVDDSIISVHLMLKHGTVTMAGGSASIPVTVSNGLQQRLDGLELRVTSSAPNRVTVRNPVTAIRAPAAANHTGRVRVSAHANGPVQITAQLFTTADGRPWGPPTTFRVQVSRISPLVVAVIAGGVLLVLLAGAFKVRRTSHRRTAPPDSGAGPA
jgi:Family of unknown function (DUF6049)